MPHTSFRSTKKVDQFLSNLSNKNSFLVQLLELVVDEKLPIAITQSGKEITVEVIDAQEQDEITQTKQTLEIKKLRSQIKAVDASTRLTNIKADFLEMTGSEMPRNYVRRINQGEPKPLTRTGKITCPECNDVFDFDSQYTLEIAKSEFSDHYFQRHGEPPESVIQEVRKIQW